MARNSGIGVRARRFVLGCAMLLLSIFSALSLRTALAAPEQGPGGPILVVTSPTSTFGTYYAEILRTEGFNAFAVADICDRHADARWPPTTSSSSAKMPLTAAQVDDVHRLGQRRRQPDRDGARSAARRPARPDRRRRRRWPNGYLLVDTSAQPGQRHRRPDDPVPRHRRPLHAERRDEPSPRCTATRPPPRRNPAVTLRSGRHAAVRRRRSPTTWRRRSSTRARATRPGPTQERDGFAPIRSDDKFFGDAAGDPQPDWVDLNKVAIPQADEQQRLLANLILHMNQAKKPLPRFWYFPHGKKAVVIMTGDDHGNGGTAGRFDAVQRRAARPAARWPTGSACAARRTSTRRRR